METIQALREHVESSQNFGNAAEFLNILNKASDYLTDQQGYEGIQLVQCIDIEGIVGVGKTALANALERSPRISGQLLSVPPNLRSFRPYFDQQQDELVKQHFFHLWDIVVSQELLLFPDTTVAILDRYWPTTIAYRLAHQAQLMLSNEDISWPLYLVRPSHIVYIYLNEEEDFGFRSRFDRVCREIRGIYPIDGNKPIDRMVDEILKWYQKNPE